MKMLSVIPRLYHGPYLDGLRITADRKLPLSGDDNHPQNSDRNGNGARMSEMPDRAKGLGAIARLRPSRVFYGWWIVVVAVLLNIFQGGVLFYGFTLIITPLREETGWTATQVTAVFPILGVLAAFIAPALGFGFDRIGPRPLLAGGLLLMGTGMVLMGQATTLPMFYAAFILANIGSTSTWMATGPAVANWFVRMRGRALGVYSLGLGLAGLMSPLLFELIEFAGWRDAMLVVGVATWAFLPLCVLVIRRRPEDVGLWPDGADGPPSAESSDGVAEVNIGPKQALRMRSFWLLSVSSSLAFLSIAALQVHWSPLLQDVGFTERSAARLLFVLPLSTIVGRIGFGFLVDIFDKRRVTATAFVLQGIAVFVLTMVDVERWWVLPVFFLFWGLGFGGTVVTRPALQAEMFGRFSFGIINGILFMTGGAGFAFAPLIASFGFESMGTFTPVLLVFAALSILAAPLVLAIQMRPVAGPSTPASPNETLANSVGGTAG
jgi:MFS family permease